MPGRSISTRASQAFNDNLERNGDRAHHVAGDAAQQVQSSTGRSSIIDATRQGRRHRDDDAGSDEPRLVPAVALQQATWSSPITSRLLLEAGWGTYQARYRNPAPRDDGTHNAAMIRALEQGGEIPNLISADARRRRRRLQSSSDRDAREHPGVAVVCHRRAQHEVRLPGRVQQSDARPTATSTRSSRSGCSDGVPNQLTQIIVADDSTRASSTSATWSRPPSTRRISGRATG